MTLSLSALNLAPFSLCFPNKDFLVYRLTKIRGRGAVGGPMNLPLDGYFVAQGSLGAIARNISAPGAYRVATLTLNVAAVPGTHRLWPAYGSYSTAPAASAAELQPGPAFEIHVGGE